MRAGVIEVVEQFQKTALLFKQCGVRTLVQHFAVHFLLIGHSCPLVDWYGYRFIIKQTTGSKQLVQSANLGGCGMKTAAQKKG